MSDTIRIRGAATLGDFLRDAGDSNPANEQEAGAIAYNPGYPAGPGSDGSLPLVDSTQDVTLDHVSALIPGEGIQDLRIDNLRSLGGYAHDLMKKSNENVPQKPTQFGRGGARGESIESGGGLPGAFVDGPWGEGDDQGSDEPRLRHIAKRNFEDLSGGQEAGPILETEIPVNELGGFFGDRLADLLIKTGRRGGKNEESANYLLKNNSLKVGAAVGDVLEKVNRFSDSADSPYFNPDAEDTDAAFNRGMWSVQTGHGKALGKFDKDAPHITLGALRGMALKLMLEATGESGVDDIIGIGDDAIGQFMSSLAAANLATINITNIPQIGATSLLFTDPARIKFVLEDGPEGLGEDDPNIVNAIRRLFNSNGADDFVKVGNAFASTHPDRSDYTVNSFSDLVVNKPFANLNSWAEPFAGFFPMGMFTATILGMVLMSLLIALMDQITSGPLFSEGVDGQPNIYNPRKLAMGQHRSAGDTDDIKQAFLTQLGFSRLSSSSSWSSAIYRGMSMFFGFSFNPETDANPLSIPRFLNEAVSFALAPGYYAVMLRIILRDIILMLKSVEAAVLSAVSGALAMGLSLIGGAEALEAVTIHTIMGVIGSSMTLNFMKISAGIGDITYMAAKEPGRVAHGRVVTTYQNEELMAQTLHPRRRLEFSRFHGGNRQPRSPLSLHLQNSLFKGRLGSTTSYAQGTITKIDEDALQTESVFNDHPLATVVMAKSQTRLSTETVKMYECAIDQEFTPFYLHDLRTNELIAMPAFITSVGESYSPEWTETHGYGRTDPVRTYSKTTRTIDLSFTLAAMNPWDMKYMWFVINKLVMMCYPQRSVGQLRTFTADPGNPASGRFIQPFSQVPTASPVVRLRLGELFHSNYSLEGLKRLFGAPDHLDLKVDDPADIAFWSKELGKSISDDQARTMLTQEWKRAFFDVDAEEVPLVGDVQFAATRASLVITLSANSGDSPGSFALPDIFASAPIEREYMIVEFNGDSWEGAIDFEVLESAAVSGLVISPGLTASPHAVDWVKEKKSPVKYYKVQLNMWNDAAAKHALGDHPILAQIDDKTSINAFIEVATTEIADHSMWGFIDPTEIDDWKTNHMEGAAIEQQKKKQEELDKQGFFTTKNAIVRSFRAAAGRGLAGVITNMTMNYDGSTWGTSFADRDRAPKMVTITLGFAPIHDLPLGLDHAGDMISPVYPVGLLRDKSDPFKTDDSPDSSQAAKAAAAECGADQYPGRPDPGSLGGEPSFPSPI